MGGKGGKVDTIKVLKSRSRNNLTLREKVTGKTKTVHPNDILKIQHMQNIALWSAQEASIHSLGMFFGHRLLAFCDSLEFPLDPSLLFCKRCASISQLYSHRNSETEANITNTTNHKGKSPSVNRKLYFCNDCSSRKTRRKKMRQSRKNSLLQVKDTDFVRQFSIVPNLASTVDDVLVDATKLTFPETLNLHVNAEVLPSLAPVSFVPETSIVGEVMPKLCTSVDNYTANTPSAEMIEMPTLITGTSPKKMELVPLLAKKRKKKKSKSKSKSKKAMDLECGSPIVSKMSPIILSSKRKRKSWTTLKDKEESIRHDKIQNSSNFI